MIDTAQRAMIASEGRGDDPSVRVVHAPTGTGYGNGKSFLFLWGLKRTREIDQTLSEIRLNKDKQVRTPENIPPAVLWFSNKMSQAVLAVVPDFAHFDFSVWLLKDHVVSWRELGSAGGKALPPILVLMALGTLLMVFKDFDR